MSHATCRAAPPAPCALIGAASITRSPSLPGRRLAWLGAALGRLARPRRRRAAIRELLRLDDRALRDIAIARGEIEEVVDALMARSPEP